LPRTDGRRRSRNGDRRNGVDNHGDGVGDGARARTASGAGDDAANDIVALEGVGGPDVTRSAGEVDPAGAGVDLPLVCGEGPSIIGYGCKGNKGCLGRWD